MYVKKGLVLSIALVWLGHAWAVDLPASAKPGGAIPQVRLPEKKLPRVAPLPVPALKALPADKPTAPRIDIKAFVIKDVVEYPAFGITRAVLERTAEKLRTQYYLPGKGLTLIQMRAVADQLTQIYRKAGYILTRVYLPKQKIGKDRVVVFKVYEGRLGQVKVEGNKRYSAALVSEPLAHLVGQPVLASNIEKALLTINNYPGLTVTGVFRKGKESGETDLIVVVREEDRFDLTLAGDNHGGELTGKRHGYISFSANNLSQSADRLSGKIIQNFKPDNGKYGLLRYERPFLSPDNMIDFDVSHNNFQLSGNFESLLVTGESTSIGIGLRRYFIRSRTANLIGDVRFDRKQSLTSEAAAVTKQDDLSVLSVGGTYVVTNPSMRNHVVFSGRYAHGFDGILGAMSGDRRQILPSRVGGSGALAPGRFNEYSINASYLQRIFSTQSLLFRVNGQYSNDILVSLEQMGMGGVNSVRGYPTSEFLKDYGYYYALEWTISAPGFSTRPVFNTRYTWGDLINVTAFAEQSVGWLNDPTASDEGRISIGGYGLGLRFGIPQLLSVQLQAAKPFGISRTPSDGKNHRFWLSFFLSL